MRGQLPRAGLERSADLPRRLRNRHRRPQFCLLQTTRCATPRIARRNILLEWDAVQGIVTVAPAAIRIRFAQGSKLTGARRQNRKDSESPTADPPGAPEEYRP